MKLSCGRTTTALRANGYLWCETTSVNEYWILAISILDWISWFGTPQWLWTKGGSHLSKGLWDELDNRRKAVHYVSPTYAAFTNGFIEKTVSVVLQTFRALLDKQQLELAD
jgi:hypothetical protein